MLTVQLYFQSAEETATNVHLFISAIKVPFEDNTIEQQLNQYAKKLNFSPKYHSIHLYAECNNKQCKHSKL